LIVRFHASSPLAVWELSGTTLTLKARLGWMPYFSQSPVVLAPADVRVVFPCRRFGTNRAIAIVTTDGEIFEFFRLGPRSAILDALAQAGFRVDRKERKGFRMRDWFESQSNPIEAVFLMRELLTRHRSVWGRERRPTILIADDAEPTMGDIATPALVGAAIGLVVAVMGIVLGISRFRDSISRIRAPGVQKFDRGTGERPRCHLGTIPAGEGVISHEEINLGIGWST
jgi:hypothetical protein